MFWVGALPLSPAAQGEGAQKPVYRQPANDPGVSTLEQRGARQLATLHEFGVFAAFQFTDEVEASGIDFVHESVDDSLKDWIPVHYDHGNSVSIADIDGDGLTDVYFLTQIGSNALYRGLGAGKFENVTESAGVGLPDRISVAASFADVDNDGDPDLFVTTVRGGNVLFLNDGEGRFADVSAAAGLDYVGHSSGSVFLDYDNDGLLDLFVTNVGTYTSDRKGRGGFYRGLEDAFQGHRYPERYERSKLYRNLGGARFEDVSEASGCCGDDGWAGDATFHDLNGDRLPDLYVLNMQGDDHYYENAGGGRFVEKGPELFPRTPWGAMGVKFFDWDNDRRFDLIVTDMHSDMHELDVEPLRDEKLKYDVPQDDDENNIDGNAFYRQNEDGSFDEISDANGAENYWPWGLSVADFNADGFEDVFIASSMNFPFRYGVNSLLLNDRGEMLRDSEFLLGVEPRRDGRTSKVLFDVDCDGADQDHARCKERTGQASMAGSLGTRASRGLRPGPGRRPRHRHGRVQRQAAGARQQPDREPGRPVDRDRPARHLVEPRRSGGAGDRRDESRHGDPLSRRQERLSRAELDAALRGTRPGAHGRAHRGRVALRHRSVRDRGTAGQLANPDHRAGGGRRGQLGRRRVGPPVGPPSGHRPRAAERLDAVAIAPSRSWKTHAGYCLFSPSCCFRPVSGRRMHRRRRSS